MRKNLAKLKNMIRIGWNYTYTHTYGRSSRELPFERATHRFNIVQLQRGGEGGMRRGYYSVAKSRQPRTGVPKFSKEIIM